MPCTAAKRTYYGPTGPTGPEEQLQRRATVLVSSVQAVMLVGAAVIRDAGLDSGAALLVVLLLATWRRCWACVWCASCVSKQSMPDVHVRSVNVVTGVHTNAAATAAHRHESAHVPYDALLAFVASCSCAHPLPCCWLPLPAYCLYVSV
jgi:hypothetical protein